MSNRRSLHLGEDRGTSQASAEAAGTAPTWRYALGSRRGNDEDRRWRGADPARPRPAMPPRSRLESRNVLGHRRPEVRFGRASSFPPHSRGSEERHA